MIQTTPHRDHTPPHQGAQQETYAGTSLLLRGESQLANYNRWIVEMFLQNSLSYRPRQPSQVLDFGAGIGTLSQIFYTLTGTRPQGVEIDPRQRSLYRDRGFVAHASLAEATGPFDLIFTSNVLEHIEDDQATLNELQSRLKPGGQLMVYVPAFRSIWTALDDHVGHYRRYTRSELERKLARASLTVTRSRYCDCVGFGLALAFKYLGTGRAEPSAASLRFFDRWLLPWSKQLDRLASRGFGKNVLAVAVKP